MTETPSSPHSELFALSEWFAALRRAEWFARVPPEAWHALSSLLSFPRRDGSLHFTVEQAAYVLGVDGPEAERRLDALTRLDWKGRSLFALERDAYGRVAGASLASLGIFEEDPASQTEGSLPLPEARLETPGEAPASPAASGLYRRLEAAGLYAEQIDRLLSAYPEDRILRQLDWLPARKARVPAALLLKAVEGDWGPPKETGNPSGEPA